jgi:hypothetical protein
MRGSTPTTVLRWITCLKVGLQLESAGGTVSILLGLDFPAERLHYDLDEGTATVDDGSRAAVLHHASVLRFQRRYIGNGSLEIWSGGRRLARKDAYLPENILPGSMDKAYDQAIAKAEAAAAERIC